jgi:predicted DNA binding protein
MDDRFVEDFVRLDRVGSEALYRIEWTETEHGLLNGIQEAQAAIMEAEGSDKWGFRLRFLSHERLATFHDYCLENDLEIELGRVFTPSTPTPSQDMYDLTPAQREALTLAVDRGYFCSPREVSLSELATELSISKQAVSQRIRRANEKVLRESLTPIEG